MLLARDRWLLAILGALLAGISWVLLVALTGLGKWYGLAVPLGPVVCLAGAVLAVSRFQLVLWIGAGAVGLLGAAVAFTPLTTTLLSPQALVRRDPPPSAPLDAVIVLSGGVTADSLLESEAADRLLTGLALMRDSAAPTLIVTRARRADSHRASADRDQAALRTLVARSFSMFVVDSVRTTRDEAVNSWRMLRERGIPAPRVALVTSPMHTRRACAAFEQVGFAVVCVPATSRAYSPAYAGAPSQRFALFQRWLYEHAAWASYRSKGWVRG